MYKYLDTKYIKPCLLRDNQYRDPKIIETFENLTNKDAVEFMKRNPTSFAGLGPGNGGEGYGGGRMPSVPGMAGNSNLLAAADNLDMKEMAYKPSVKDQTETRVRHMLTENMFMPRARVSGCF